MRKDTFPSEAQSTYSSRSGTSYHSSKSHQSSRHASNHSGNSGKTGHSSGTHHTSSSLGGQTHRDSTDRSYYSCGNVPCGTTVAAGGADATWMYARDTRQQVSRAGPPKYYGYPSDYRNQESLGTKVMRQNIQREQQAGRGAPYTHVPLLPGQQEPYKQGQPGAWRSLYNDQNRDNFDVMYHDPNKPPKKGGKHKLFSL